MTATAPLTSPGPLGPLGHLYFVMHDQDRADLIGLIDDAHVKTRTPLGERLAVLRRRLDRRGEDAATNQRQER